MAAIVNSKEVQRPKPSRGLLARGKDTDDIYIITEVSTARGLNAEQTVRGVSLTTGVDSNISSGLGFEMLAYAQEITLRQVGL